ncbi:cysteine dioxygenase family protein [Lentibacillus sp. Marseille-P4043]|uniref:cysteine dioxygenase family protein n=1 Tax=Lentibacillus sp. Marseille-P4043 TaxID=2040293 RepID=UPI000D0AE2E8|nr:cysteine dioxygenase family protein [Lentibacillus sp. Marseille-P4043]
MELNKIKYNLSDFIKDLTNVVEATNDDSERVSQAEHHLSKLLCTKSWLPMEKLSASNNNYARHSLYRDPQDRFEVLALIWEPGQSTPLHDHDGTWGVEGVVSGRMKILNYLQLESYSDQTTKLHHAGTMTINEQSTGELLPPADCHILKPEGGETVITVHVYGKQLKKFRIFERTDQDNIFIAHEKPVGYTTEP